MSRSVKRRSEAVAAAVAAIAAIAARSAPADPRWTLEEGRSPAYASAEPVPSADAPTGDPPVVANGSDPLAIPGLSGTNGNDLTLDYLMGKTSFDALPAYPRFYFSRADNPGCPPDQDGDCLPAGVDANPCTIAAPCRTVAKAWDLMQSGRVIAVFDAQDSAWIAASDDWGDFKGGTISGTCTNTDETAMADEGWAYMISSDPERPVVFDGSHFAIDDTIDALFRVDLTGGCYVGFAGIRSENLPRSPENTAFTNAKAIFEVAGGHLVTVGSFCDGLVGIEVHCLSQEGDGGIVSINSGARHRPTSDFNENAACAPTATCCSGLDTPYEGCTGDAISYYEGNAHSFEVGDWGGTRRGGYMVIGGEWTIQTDQLLDGVGADSAGWNQQISNLVFEPSANGYDAVILGVTSRGPDAITRAYGTFDTSFCFGIWPQPNTSNNRTRFYLGRSTCAGWPEWTNWTSRPMAAFVANNDYPQNTAGSIEGWLFQNTVKDTYKGFEFGGQFPEDRIDFDIQCNLFDALRTRSGEARAVDLCFGNAGLCYITGDDSNVYDAVSGSFTVFLDPGGARYTASAVVDSYGSGCATGTAPCFETTPAWFGDDGANELGGTEVDGDAFGAFAAEAACQEDKPCYDRCGTRTKTTPEIAVFVPSAVGGAPIETFTLGTHYHHAGARVAPLAAVPAMSPAGVAAAGLLMLCAGGCALRRRRP
jgi:hypothetical protein